jgi:hypothetical protein
MQLYEATITPQILDLLKDRIQMQTGRSRNPAVARKIRQPLESILAVVETKVRPKAVFDMLPILDADDRIVKTPAGLIQSPMLSAIVRRCRQNANLVFMAATIGDALEKLGRAAADILESWLYDMVGSELVDLVADAVENDFKAEEPNCCLEFSMRSSPGYCDWSVEGQKIIFTALDPSRIGVTLTPYMLMIPRKTLSGVLVAAEEVPVKFACALCAKKDCPWRRG